ncbi:hypothetical protein lerEdw1_006563 [Lerista edwardsae]|nr:hypothetical protein lerEdw1_006563 [Lerista edwardsae]
MNSSGLPCTSPVAVAVAAAVGPPPGPGLPSAAASVVSPGGVKLKFCHYYAKDKTCFYGGECHFLHEEPGGGGSAACPGPPPPAAPGGFRSGSLLAPLLRLSPWLPPQDTLAAPVAVTRDTGQWRR